MPDAIRGTSAAGANHSFAIAERMSREVALMGGRLAGMLSRAPVATEGPLAQGQTFLSAMFESQAPAPSAATADGHPLDRLSAPLALTRIKQDLIVLAAMAEEHEGYASIVRSLNPRSEPHATSGLA